MYFSTKCLSYRQQDFSKRLNDRLVDYIELSRQKGIKPCRDQKDVRKRISEGKLIEIKTGNRYIVDRMTYSYPCVTRESKMLLDEIARRFREKTSAQGLQGARFIITSMTRQEETMKSLRKNNYNASANSPHLYGNAFDITYMRFDARKWVLTNCDKQFMKAALSEVIWELRLEKKCWATFERTQSCFHVVAR